MKAIVCDKCGKVILLPEEMYPYEKSTGVCHLIVKDRRELDLCEECTEELMAAVRKENDYEMSQMWQ